MGRMLPDLALAATLCLAACTGKKPPPGQPAGNPERCDGYRERLTQWYRAEAEADGASPELAVDLTESNVEMVLTDCRAEPGRVLQCLASAGGIADVESKCVIPLDDEGNVEARLFADD